MMCNEFVEHVLSVKINMIIIFEGVLLGCLRKDTYCAAGIVERSNGGPKIIGVLD